MSFHAIQCSYQSINLISRSLIQEPAFQDVNVVLPAANSAPELAFIRATSWLYCLYFEAGRCSIKFLLQLADSYNLDTDKYREHMDEVRCLRTEFHHNLGFSDSDYRSRRKVEDWYLSTCKTRRPASNEHWESCYKSLTDEENDKSSPAFLRFLEDVIRNLEQDSHLQNRIDDWIQRLNNDFPAARFDPLIEDAKVILGRSALDTIKFRNRFVSRWKKELEKLEEGYVFNDEASLLIEREILNDSTELFPLTGGQIIKHLNVKAGPEVGELLKHARTLYEAGIRDSQTILKKLEDFKQSNS